MISDLEAACRRFLAHIETSVVEDARGDHKTQLTFEPEGTFWLGRVSPEEAVIQKGMGLRGDRIDPCAIGIRVIPAGGPPWVFTVNISCRAWLREKTGSWNKTPEAKASISITAEPDSDFWELETGASEIQSALTTAVGAEGLSASIRLEVTPLEDGSPELAIMFVNTSPAEHEALKETTLFEARMEVSGLPTRPFLTESLKESFRYDRRVAAFGINCGVETVGESDLRTVDTLAVDRGRPTYWNVSNRIPDLSFDGLAVDPIPALDELVDDLRRWGSQHWSEERLLQRSADESWTDEMMETAKTEAGRFAEELARIEEGLTILRDTEDVLHAFKLMNEAIAHSSQPRGYNSWRPFQIGFLLANLRMFTESSSEAELADIVWFATGGGKTETYLGLLIMAALHDRMRGKVAGISAWSRFPLRMLSLQQTQRFADAMAGAELARQHASLDGDPFSVGFLVGAAGTPNEIKTEPDSHEPDPDDDDMPAHFQVLLRCPFCHQPSIEMGFNRRVWRLEHRCINDECPWDRSHLPFYIVDQEIYRYLPTILVGTLDKAATISMQAAMRGLVGSPGALCSREEHGYAYAPRSKRPTGCLVPGCNGTREPLPMDRALYGPTYRLQDELHLLRDSLGAVDSHYESLLDHLEHALTGVKPKILASSATLEGYQSQVEVLYQREARVFPIPGPAPHEGFWSAESGDLARRYVAVAPRGATIEFATERLLGVLQMEVRKLLKDPQATCEGLDIDPELSGQLASLYGADVVYGNTLRDLDAFARSLTSLPIDPLNAVTLTGDTEFDEVRTSLERLERPEDDFAERIHLIAASSMMSHGVDIDRLNAMVMLGLPLTTAEFIQATARVGRRHPGIVFVLHKIIRERDASIYRNFDQFIRQGDRFVEPVPVTRKSRRVLDRTIAGLMMGRLLHIHEPSSGISLATVSKLKAYFKDAEVDAHDEMSEVINALDLTGPLEDHLRQDLDRWFEDFFRNLNDPAGDFTFPSDLCPLGPPMRSLRDVEEQAPIRSSVAR